ncbi:hypothetical protein B0H13DRAFT_2321843 [Mycena leptocephala]|nr:hypothetical protein B0H13DRAFT_2321843 [Mycena leptocephala]
MTAKRKFLVSTPALEKAKVTKKKRSRNDSASSSAKSDSTSSKPRKRSEIPKNPAPTTGKSRKSKSNPDDDVLKKGPFNISSTHSYYMRLPIRPN